MRLPEESFNVKKLKSNFKKIIMKQLQLFLFRIDLLFLFWNVRVIK